MKIRADIAELLRAGVPQIHICRQLHCAPITVQRTREALRLPAPKPCRVLPASLEEAFRQYTQATKDGHIAWTGPTLDGVPRVRFEGSVHYARRLAFRFHHGREPEGPVTCNCDAQLCVRGDHLEDRSVREANRRADKAFTAIFGEAA